MELCSLLPSLSSPLVPKQPQGIDAQLILCLDCDSVPTHNHTPRTAPHPLQQAFLLFVWMPLQLRRLKAPDLKVTNATTKLDFRLGMCRPQ